MDMVVASFIPNVPKENAHWLVQEVPNKEQKIQQDFKCTMCNLFDSIICLINLKYAIYLHDYKPQIVLKFYNLSCKA